MSIMQSSHLPTSLVHQFQLSLAGNSKFESLIEISEKFTASPVVFCHSCQTENEVAKEDQRCKEGSEEDEASSDSHNQVDDD